jgi:hypothetical protein
MLGNDGVMSSAGELLLRHLLDNRKRTDMRRWLLTMDVKVRFCLTDIVRNGRITWAMLDLVEPVAGGRLLRRLCLQANVIEARPNVGKVERLLAKASSALGPTASVLCRFWHDELLPRVVLRSRSNRFDSRLNHECNLLNVAQSLLAFIGAESEESLSEVNQRDVDRWLEVVPGSYRNFIGRFWRWLRAGNIVTFLFHAKRVPERSRDQGTREMAQMLAQRVRTDESIDLQTRAGFLLMAVHGRYAHEIASLSLNALQQESDTVVWVSLSERLSTTDGLGRCATRSAPSETTREPTMPVALQKPSAT